MEVDSRKYADFIKDHPVVYFDCNLIKVLSGSELKIMLVFIMLGRHNLVGVTYEDIEFLTGLTHDTVFRNLKKLESRGLLLHCRKQFNQSTRHPTLYLLKCSFDTCVLYSVKVKYIKLFDSNSFLLYVYLQNHCGCSGPRIVSISEMSKTLNLNRQTIIRHLTDLSKKSIITLRPIKSGGCGCIVSYELMVFAGL